MSADDLNRLQEAKKEQNRAIIDLIKEMYRLQLPGSQKATTPELEEAIIGRDE